MTMRNDIKSMIEAILDSQVSEIEYAVNLACDKVEEIMDNIELIIYDALHDLDDEDNIEDVKKALQRAYDDI